MMTGGKPFREIWAADFEFRAPPGHNPEPHLPGRQRAYLGPHHQALARRTLRAAAKPPYDTASR